MPSFLRTTPAGFAATVAVQAFRFGSRDTDMSGIIDCNISGNSAINAITNSRTFFMDGAENCAITNNNANSPIGGEGAFRVENSTLNKFRDNKVVNSIGYGLDFKVTSTDNDIIGGSVAGSAVGIQDLGARNLKSGITGWASRKTGTTAIQRNETRFTQGVSLDVFNISRLRVSVTALSPLYAGTSFYVENITQSSFDLVMNVAPGGNNIAFFAWEAYESRD